MLCRTFADVTIDIANTMSSFLIDCLKLKMTEFSLRPESGFLLHQMPTKAIASHRETATPMYFVAPVDDTTLITLDETKKVTFWNVTPDNITVFKVIELFSEEGLWEVLVVDQNIFILGVYALHILDISGSHIKSLPFTDIIGHNFGRPMLTQTKQFVIMAGNTSAEVYSHSGDYIRSIPLYSYVYTVCALSDTIIIIGTDNGLFLYYLEKGKLELLLEECVLSLQYFSELGRIYCATQDQYHITYDVRKRKVVFNYRDLVANTQKIGRQWISTVYDGSRESAIWDVKSGELVQEFYDEVWFCAWSHNRLVRLGERYIHVAQ